MLVAQILFGLPQAYLFGIPWAMDFRLLRYFIATIEEGSLQGASRRVNIAQPALSRRIRDLELSLGCSLLVRGPRGVTATRAGLALYQDAVELVKGIDRAFHNTRRIGLEQGRGARMGLAPTIARKYRHIGDALEAFLRSEQHNGIAFVRAFSSELAESLREGTIDLALLYEQRPDSAQVADRLVHREAYVLAAHPGHRLAVAGAAELAELAGKPLIWLARHDVADSVNPLALQLRRHGLEPVIAQVADSPDEQIDITIASAGICLTPASTILATPPGKLVFRALPRLEATMDLTLAWRREGAGGLALELVAELNVAIDRHQASLAGGNEPWATLDGHVLYQLP